MRFEIKPTPKKPALSGRDRLRLWALVVCLAMVLAAMKQLSKPETAERLDSLFGIQALSDGGNTPPDSEAEATADAEALAAGVRSELLEMAQGSGNYEEIKDNTYFRPEEGAAWFAAFARLQETPAEEIVEQSLGEISYAQFINQPNEYRHRVVTIEGTVVREEIQRPIENQAGIESYHRLWIAPQGGSRKPLVVYCRILPDAFPRGDDLREAVSVTGEFFKNWSYHFEGGMGLAPVILAHEVTWNQSVTNSSEVTLPVKSMIWSAAGAGVLALIVVWVAVRNTTRRSRHTNAMPETFIPPVLSGELNEESDR